jgi:hypothetical protein
VPEPEKCVLPTTSSKAEVRLLRSVLSLRTTTRSVAAAARLAQSHEGAGVCCEAVLYRWNDRSAPSAPTLLLVCRLGVVSYVRRTAVTTNVR